MLSFPIRLLYQSVLCKQAKGIAPAICNLLAQVKPFTPVNWKVTVWGSSLILTLLQKKPSLKYYIIITGRLLVSLCATIKTIPLAARGSPITCCPSFYKSENSSSHLFAFRPCILNLDGAFFCSVGVIYHVKIMLSKHMGIIMSQGNKTHQIMTELNKIIDAALCAINHSHCVTIKCYTMWSCYSLNDVSESALMPIELWSVVDWERQSGHMTVKFMKMSESINWSLSTDFAQ